MFTGKTRLQGNDSGDLPSTSCLLTDLLSLKRERRRIYIAGGRNVIAVVA